MKAVKFCGYAGAAVDCNARAETPCERQQLFGQPQLLVFRQILFANTDPAASGRYRGAYHVRKGMRGLLPIGDQEQRRLGQYHVPAMPSVGLAASAELFLS